MSSSPRSTSTSVWVLVSLPGIALLGVLLYAVLARFSYPYDLEWMEGGLLTHATRIAAGKGIYVKPSIEFVPYLYTPLYPGLLAASGELFGITYQLGRAISIVSMISVLVLMVRSIVYELGDELRPVAWCGAAVAVGLFSATYPWVEGWYDIVRADTLFLLMAVGGLAIVRRVARTGEGANGQLQIAGAAALLAFSFFCKQTGIFFVALGGLYLLVYNWRRVPIYVATSALIGLGGTWLMNRATHGWFWTYIYQVHQSHDFNTDRVVASFPNILLHFPIMTVAILLATIAVLATAIAKRKLTRGAEPFLFWMTAFVASTVVGAISWGTQFAHFNAYIPAMTTGAVAAGLALPALIAAMREWDTTPPPLGLPTSSLIGYVAAGALAWQLIHSFWAPGRFIPTDADRQAGDALIKRIAAIDGDVLVPFHPWYARIAGKRTFAHRMGLVDMSEGRGRWHVEGVREAFENHYFEAVILDNRPTNVELAGLRGPYRLDDYLSAGERPRVYTGAGAAYSGHLLFPETVWVPAIPLEPPPNVRVIDSFESGRFKDWKVRGSAWGHRPASTPLPKQGPVSRYGGRYYVTSFHGGDDATGILTSSEFEVSGNLITMRLSGGQNLAQLRAELVVDGQVVRSATGMQSDRMREVVWSVAPYMGTRARIRLVDDARGPWGHLNVDEIWLHEAKTEP